MYRLLTLSSSTAAALVLLVAGLAMAGTTDDWQPPRFEVGAFGGVVDYDTARGVNGQIYGGRFGINFSPQVGLEAVVGRSAATSSAGRPAPTFWFSQADLVLHLLPGRLIPYVSGGGGNLSSTVSGAQASQDRLHLDAGGGVKLWLANHVALRADVHGYWGNGDGPDGSTDRYRDVTATVSLGVGLGSARHVPADADGDGIPDVSDRCTGTPIGVAVDTFGCPADIDSDGVPDHLDRCPRTSLYAWVDDHGCPTDEDADGVYDGLDRCLETPAGARVDDRGCPIDSDGDGVYDGLDRCGETPAGVAVDERGCREVTTEVKTIERRLVLHSINFASGKADILPSSYDVLDELAESLLAYRDATMEIRGYADAAGSESLNLILTQRRADAVRVYLISRGVEPSRLVARGYGEADPISPNDTPEGRAMNRRVEFHRMD